MRVWLGRLVHERNDVEPSPGSIVHIAERRLVISTNGQLETGHEGKEISLHEAGSDRVAAGQGFDACLCPCLPFLGFCCHHQSRTGEHSKVCWMTVASGHSEGVHGCGG